MDRGNAAPALGAYGDKRESRDDEAGTDAPDGHGCAGAVAPDPAERLQCRLGDAYPQLGRGGAVLQRDAHGTRRVARRGAESQKPLPSFGHHVFLACLAGLG